MVVSFTIPAAALSSSDAVSFGKWLASIPYTPGTALETSVDWFKSKFSSDGDSSAYSTYVSSVDSTLGTSVVGDNCAYLGNWSLDYSRSDSVLLTNATFQSGSTFNIDSFDDSSNQYTTHLLTIVSSFVAPVSGTYLFARFIDGNYSSFAWNQIHTLIYLSSDSTVVVGDTNGDSVTSTLTAGETYTFRLTFYWYGGAAPWSYSTRGACRINYPSNLSAVAGDVDVSPETRTGSLCGDYFYEGDDGTMMQAENISFVDETNNTVYNPATDTTATASSWVYDYATRTYTITATDGSTYKICMGDDAATEAVTDSAGTTVTYNYYYASDSTSTDGSSSGGTLWDFLSSIVDAITGLGSSIITGLSNIVSSAISGISDVISSLTGGIFTKLSDFLFGNGTSQSCTDFYNSPSTYSGVSVWD